MLKNKKMFEDVFHKVDLESVQNEKGGLDEWQCAAMWLACLNELAYPCGSQGSCELYYQFCAKNQ